MIFNNITMANDNTPNGDHLEFSPTTDAYIPDDGPQRGEDYELTKATGPEAARTGDAALESLFGLMLEQDLTRKEIEAKLTGAETLIGNAANFPQPSEGIDLRVFLAKKSAEVEAARTLKGNAPNF